MTTCPKPEELMLYVAGELPPDAARALEAHLASCGRCAREAATIRRGQDALRLLDREPTVRPEAMAALRARLRQAAAERRRPVILSLARRYGWVAAAAALLVAAVYWHGYEPNPQPVPQPGTTVKADFPASTDALDEVAVAVELLSANLNSASDLPAASNGTDAGGAPTDDVIDDMHLLLEYLSGGSGSRG